MRIGDLFAGIGGFSLAAKWMGWETVWYSEIDPYACKVMEKNFPGVPNFGDITKIDGSKVPPVDMLCGGFPCQDISGAGKGEGLDGKRSGLWSHFARLISEIQPRWVLVENVPALRSRGLDRVLKDLCEIGYDAEWHCIPAKAIGAPHQRDRIWILAYPKSLFRNGGKNYAQGCRTVLGSTSQFGNCNSPERERESAVDGFVNPTFVEWLMGFPLGWTIQGD